MFPPRVEQLEDRTLPAGNSLATAVPINPSGAIVDQIGTPGEMDFFKFTVNDSGRLTARAAPSNPLGSRLSLLGPSGELLIQSDGASATDPDDLIVQHLLAGTYFLQVEGLGGGTGAYTLTTEFVPAVPPFQPLPVGSSGEIAGLVTGDFNGDGFSDLVRSSPQASYVSVCLGLGDGTFRQQLRLEVGDFRVSVAPGDFNGDGRLDLALGQRFDPFVEVVLGRGDGTFEKPMRFAAGVEGDSVTTADFNSDGFLDLAVANYVSSDISILLGRGDGTFRDQLRVPVAGGPTWLLAADFNRDGRPDLASVNFDADDVSILLGRGDGTFQNERRFQVGDVPFGGDVGDFNGDGFLDLAVVNDGSPPEMSVLLGRGDGTFGEERRLAVGRGSRYVSARDFNGDGQLDLAVASTADLSVFLGRGDGTFTDPAHYAGGLGPRAVVASDFNGDGRLDLASFGSASFDLSILFGRGDGTFSSQGRVEEYPTAWTSVSGDFNSDGRLDLATSNTNFDAVAVSLGLGDGTFQPPVLVATNANPRGIATGDFNGDGRLDLATTSSRTNDVMILLGRGNGTFQAGLTFKLDRSDGRQSDVRTGDFNSDGRLDLAVVNQEGGTISVLLGRGDGTFDDQVRYPVGRSRDMLTGDFNGDGHPDLVAADFVDSEIVVLLGRGDGTFHEPARFAVARSTRYLAAADFNGDGRLDLATTNGNFHFAFGVMRVGEVSVLLGRGDGTFQEPVRVASGFSPISPVAGDFNGDGRQDLAVNDWDTGQVSVLLGRGDGTFQEPVWFEVGDFPFGPFPGDFNGDGVEDLAFRIRGTAEQPAQAEAVLLGAADGTFGGPLRFAFSTSITSTSLAAGDLNNDGRLDVVTPLTKSGKAAIFLGRGDGTFQDSPPLATGTDPVSVQTGDFNGDGRLDLATANYLSGDVTVSLGLGDGTYRDPVRFAVGIRPVSLVLGDFNGDGRVDLATANSGSDDVSVLLGRGEGMFRSEVRLAVGTVPLFLLAADINGDGRLDLATANYVSGDVSLLFGRGDGTFRAETRIAAGAGPVALGVGDFNRDGRPDLAVANPIADEVSVLLSVGRISNPSVADRTDWKSVLQEPDGTFQASGRLTVGRLPRSLAVDDFNGDGFLDLAAANNNSDDVSVLLGRGDGTFHDQVRYPVARYPFALVAADLNGDGRVDLATANQLGAEMSVLLGLGDGTFVTPDTLANPRHATPLVADLSGDGVADVTVVNRAGQILFRRGRAGAPGAFEAPVVVNPPPNPPPPAGGGQGGGAARDLALVTTNRGPLLAALDAHSSSVSLYARADSGTFTRIAGLAVPGTLAVRLASGDLNGDGRGDLVVVTAGSREVFVFYQDAAGGFGPVPDHRHGVGVGASDLALADVDGDGRKDVVVTSQFSGDVTILLNDPLVPFSEAERFRAGTGLYYLDNLNGTALTRSGEGTVSLVAGNFDADPLVELVVTNSGSNSISVLNATQDGGLLNPQKNLTFPTGINPALTASGDFNRDGWLDLAVLNEGSADLSVFLGDGGGGFTEMARPHAGNLPTGLSVHDVDGDGRLDLLVGNDFGDVLTLLGNGDGTFQPYQRAGRNIALAVVDLNGDGHDDFVFANESRDRVSVQYSQPGQTFAQDRSDGLLAPGAVTSADLNRDGWLDLLIANSGSNSVLVYLGTGGGQFGPAQTFFAGTNPVGITVEDLNGDQLPDLVVANEGSNDLTLLMGQESLAGASGPGNLWTLIPGPRLEAGLGPVSTTVRDVTGDGRPDILVADRDANNVLMLPGVGGGFFNDQTPTRFATGAAPQQVFVGNFDARPGLDLVTINAGSNDLTFFSGFGPGRAIASGGETPLAALAGDFNHDGFDDLLVANNGDGRVALLLGEADGLALAQTFAHPDVPHPTALALSEEGDRLDVYVAEEGQESALLLTSFGIVVPVEVVGPPPPLPDIFLVNGPGLPTGIDILDRVGQVADLPPESGAGSGTAGVGQVADLPPESGAGSGTAGQRPAPPPGQGAESAEGELATTLVAVFLLGGGGEGGDPGRTELLPFYGGDPSDAGTAPLTRFMIGLEEAFGGRPDTAEQDPGPEALTPQTVDQVFRQWLRDLRPQEVLDGVIEALREAARQATVPGAGQAPPQAPADPGWLPPGELEENPFEPRKEKDEPPEEDTELPAPSARREPCPPPALAESVGENPGAWAGPWTAAFLLAAVPGLQDAATRRAAVPAARTQKEKKK